MRKTIVSATLALLAVAGLTVDASAQTRRRVRAVAPVVAASPDLGSSIPLTVNRRSWLDSGNSVSSRGGYGPSYVAANTIYNKTQDQIFNPGYFGNSTINQGPPLRARPFAACHRGLVASERSPDHRQCAPAAELLPESGTFRSVGLSPAARDC